MAVFQNTTQPNAFPLCAMSCRRMHVGLKRTVTFEKVLLTDLRDQIAIVTFEMGYFYWSSTMNVK